MTVPRSLKLTEAELPSFAQLGHQLAAAARPGMSIHELVLNDGVGIGQRADATLDRRGKP